MQYTTSIHWQPNDQAFTVKTYDRTHTLALGSGAQIAASSAPEFMGNAKLANPEELYTASISSCFMLTFLYWAALKGLVVENYTAEAIGKLGKNEEGKMAMVEVNITPTIQFQVQPEANVLEELFKKAHDNCFISSSVKTKVSIQSGL